MRKLATAFTSFSLLGLLSVSALAEHYKDLKENITIPTTIYVNGTKVKPGNYKVRYDATTHVMKLEQDGEVVVEAKASIVVNESKFKRDSLLTRGNEDLMQLTGIRLGGQREEIQLDALASEITAFLFMFPDADLSSVADDENVTNVRVFVTEGGDIIIDNEQ